MIAVPTLQVRPTMLLVYDTYLDRSYSYNSKPPKQFDRFANIDKAAYSGQLSLHAKKRLSKALNLLVAISRPKSVFNPSTGKQYQFRVNFVTLTLPAAQRSVSDRELKKHVFDPFIKSMKYKHGLRSYVWRAERQFNGNLHFHITTDTFLPLTSIRDQWNRYLSRFHFIDEFQTNHGHDQPNSTDVHSVHKIDNIAAYMVKYMSKDPVEHLIEVNAKRISKGLAAIDPDLHPFRKDPNQPKWDQPIEGKVWDCSSNLKTKHRCEMHMDSGSNDELSFVLKYPNTDYCETDHCFIISLKSGRMESVLPPRLKRQYLDYLGTVRNYRRESAMAARKKVLDEILTADRITRDILAFKPPKMIQSHIDFTTYRLT